MLQDFNTYSAITDYLNKSYAASMIRYAPNGTAPLFGLTSMLSEGKCTSVEHGYFAKTMVFPQVIADGTIDNVTTALVVDDSSNLVVGQMLRNQTTGEIVRVTTITDATNIVIARGIGQVAAAAITDLDVLYSVGNAYEQASLRPSSRLMNPVRVINNTQIFRNSWALPKTMSVIAAIVGDTLSGESREDCGLFHASDIERAMFFGQKSGQIINQQYLTTMDGIVETVRRLGPAANTNTAGATTNYTQFEGFLNGEFDTINNGRNGNERLLFVGGTARTVINNIGRLSGTYHIVDGQTNFGLQFSTFKTSRGTFRMIEHPQFNSNDDWSKMAIGLDLGSIKMCYLRKTENLEYGMNGTPVDDGIDAVGGTLTTEVTMEIVNPAVHAVTYGLTAGAAG